MLGHGYYLVCLTFVKKNTFPGANPIMIKLMRRLLNKDAQMSPKLMLSINKMVSPLFKDNVNGFLVKNQGSFDLSLLI